MDTFFEHFELLADAPNGVKKLREMILQLAVQGKLVPQDPNDEPAEVLLARISAARKGLGGKRNPKVLPDPQSHEVPEELPESWVWTRLSSVGIINPRNQAEDSQEASFVPMAAISSEYGQAIRPEDRLWGEVRKGFTHFAEGDVVVAKITPCFQNGKSAAMRGLINGLGAGTTELHVFRSMDGLVFPEYVLVYLKSPRFLLEGERVMTGSAGQKRVPKDYFAHNPFPLPPLAEQKRIVAKVDELMALCDDLKERQAKRGELRVHLSKSSLNALTTADASRAFTKHWGHIHRNFDRLYDTPGTVGDLRQNILQLAVQGKLVPQDPNDEPAEVLLSRISEERTRRLDKGYPNPAEARSQLKKQQRQQIPSGLPRLPAGWKWASLIQSALVVVDCHNKTAPYASKGIPLLRTSNIRRGKLALDTLCYVTPEIYERWSARCIPEAGDILITREAPMGEVARIPDGMQVCMGQRIMLIRCLEDLMSADFLLLSLRSPDLMNRVQDKPVGSTVKHLRVGGVETLLMPTPPLAEQKRIAAKVDELMALCDDLEAKLQQGRSDSERLMEVLVREICT